MPESFPSLIVLFLPFALLLCTMPQSYFPLRWESTGDQWWYASPIDWAAANGHYDLVRELLHLDTNLLIMLTSLRRIRRLETVWDDDAQFVDAAKCRSFVARSLLHECETKSGNSLISAGYGGWLLYTAASAGDITFVKELLERDPLLVFGEGEYGVTEIFYGAARGKNTELFRLVFQHALFPSLVDSGGDDQAPSTRGSGNLSFFRCEIVNRAVLAAARGGCLEMLKELLSDCSDVLVYRDSLGSTILHAASGRGQIEVVEELIASFDIITSKDNQGNTALHVAAFRGHLTVVEALVSASPSLSNIKNKVGDTFLHMAVAGFRTQGFNRLDRQMELVRQLIYGKVVKIHEIINIQNNYGRTALHAAVIGKMHPDLVKLLMSIPSINLNIRDVDGMTPLDLLSQSPPSASSDVVIKQLLCAGGLSNSDGFKAKSAIVSQLKMQCGIGNSPGSSFRISDVEILLHTGIEVSQTRGRPSSSSSVDKSEPPHFGTIQENQEYAGKKKVSANVDTAARRLKFLLRWPNQKEKRTDDESMGSLMKWSEQEETPIPLRQRFYKGSSSLINNKRTLAVKTSSASPATKKKLATGLMHGVIQAMPHLASTQQWTQVSPLSRPLVSSPKLEKRKVKGVHKMTGATSSSSMSQTEGCPSHRSGFMNAKLMNQYLCFKSNILEMEKPSNGRRHGRIFRSYVPAVA